MGSVGRTVDAAKRSKRITQNNPEISKQAALLIAQHGEDAGAMAARRADALFRQGKAGEGTRWLAIFRTIALTRPGRAP